MQRSSSRARPAGGGSRKHTRFVERDLRHLTTRAVGQLGNKLRGLDQRVSAYKEESMEFLVNLQPEGASQSLRFRRSRYFRNRFCRWKKIRIFHPS